MKFEKNTKYNTYALLALIVVAFAGVLISISMHAVWLAVFFSRMFSVFMPLLYAVIIMLVLLPGVDFFDKRFRALLKNKKNSEKKASLLSVLCTYLILLLVIALAVVIIIPQFSILYDFILGSTEYLSAVEKFAADLTEQSQFLGERFSELVQSFKNALFDYVKSLPTLATKIAAALGSVVSSVSDWVLGLIISVYAMLRRSSLKTWGRKLNAALFPQKASAKVAGVARELYNHTVWFFSARAYNMLALAIVFYAALLLMGLKFHPVLCLVIAICSLVPVFGMLIGGAVSTIIVLITDPNMTVWFIAVFSVLMILNHLFLRPRLTNSKVRLGLGTTMVCVLIGYFVFELVGALFAVPVYVTVRNLFIKWRDKKTAKKEEKATS